MHILLSLASLGACSKDFGPLCTWARGDEILAAEAKRVERGLKGFNPPMAAIEACRQEGRTRVEGLLDKWRRPQQGASTLT